MTIIYGTHFAPASIAMLMIEVAAASGEGSAGAFQLMAKCAACRRTKGNGPVIAR